MTELYTVLPEGAWIRVLRLLPGQGHEPIECEYRLANLGTDPEYEAISYAWGDPLAKKEILCNGSVVKVTVSLEGALRRFRYAHRARHLWVDGICINQADDLERAEQVNMMGDIFASATKVLIWSGQDDYDQALAAFELLGSLLGYYVAELEATYLDGSDPSRAFEGLPAPSEGEIFMQPVNWVPVRALFALPWFSRVWVCQEVAVAKSAEFSWGDHSTQFSLIVESATIIYTQRLVLPFDTMLHSQANGLVTTFELLWTSYHNEPTWRTEYPLMRYCSENHFEAENFLLVLAAASKFTATDKRDHVYAFLGHPAAKTGSSSHTIVKADYRKSLQSLYYKLAVKIIRTNGLQILAAVSHPSESELGNLPASWVPQWHQRKDGATMDTIMTAWHPKVLDDETLDEHRLVLTFAQHSNDNLVYAELRTRGLVIGTISLVSDSFHHDMVLQDATGPRRRNPVDDTFQMLSDHGIRPSDLSLEAIMHLSVTLAAGRNDQGLFLTKDEIDANFEDFLAYCNENCSPKNLLALQQVMSIHRPGRRPPSEVGSARRFAHRIYDFALDRRLFVSEPGTFIGLCPSLTKVGDICCMIIGIRMPFVVRLSNRRPVPDKSLPKATHETTDRYQLLGPAFIHGVMRGELERSKNCDDLQDIVLV